MSTSATPAPEVKCEFYVERKRDGARQHRRAGEDPCAKCSAAASAAARISKLGFDPWAEAGGTPTWPAAPLREYVDTLHDFDWALLPEWLRRRLYRTEERLTDRTADRCAIWFEVPPATIWPDWDTVVNTADPTIDTALAGIPAELFTTAV